MRRLLAALLFGLPVAIFEMSVSDSVRMPGWYRSFFSPGDVLAQQLDSWFPPHGPGLFPGFVRDIDVSIGTNWVLYAGLFWAVFTVVARRRRRASGAEAAAGL